MIEAAELAALLVGPGLAATRLQGLDRAPRPARQPLQGWSLFSQIARRAGSIPHCIWAEEEAARPRWLSLPPHGPHPAAFLWTSALGPRPSSGRRSLGGDERENVHA
jgi:hypothetical protein